MNGVGSWYDNAPMESFFATLKSERVHHCIYQTREEARTDLFFYIEARYNPCRLHSSLGYLSPEAFEQAYHQRQGNVSQPCVHESGGSPAEGGGVGTGPRIAGAGTGMIYPFTLPWVGSNDEAGLVDEREKVQVWEAALLELSEEKRRTLQEVLIDGGLFDLAVGRCDSRA